MQQDHFWRGFTWKRFILYTLLWLVVKISGELLFSLFDHTFYSLFTYRKLARYGIESVVMGLLFSLWFEPRMDKDFWKRKKKD